MTIRPAVHLSSAYHRGLVGTYCDVAECQHPDHVNPYRFYCVNPHCRNAAHTGDASTTCRVCNGTGQDWEAEFDRPCLICGGSGIIITDADLGQLDETQEWGRIRADVQGMNDLADAMVAYFRGEQQ